MGVVVLGDVDTVVVVDTVDLGVVDPVFGSLYCRITQSSIPQALFGSPGYQFDQINGLEECCHTKCPSTAESVSPIQ